MKDLIKKEKHDHKLTNMLKFVIFAIVMLAPFIAILSKIVYVSANKNAKDSYYGETINESKYENVETLKINNTYYLINNVPVNTNNQYVNDYWQISVTNFTYQDIQYSTIKFFVVAQSSNLVIQLIEYGQTTLNVSLGTTLVNINFTIMGTMEENGLYRDYIKPYLYEIIYNKNSYLDNVFYYAVDQSKESELLKWTKNTPIYNAINAMNTGLGLSSNHILTYLLTYWSIMIAIYIIFDIIIFALTKLTHWLN